MLRCRTSEIRLDRGRIMVGLSDRRKRLCRNCSSSRCMQEHASCFEPPITCGSCVPNTEWDVTGSQSFFSASTVTTYLCGQIIFPERAMEVPDILCRRRARRLALALISNVPQRCTSTLQSPQRVCSSISKKVSHATTASTGSPIRRRGTCGSLSPAGDA